jgi:hypothetical protein
MKNILTAITVIVSLNLNGQALKVTTEHTGAHIDVSCGGWFFTSYRFADDEKYPFFFPVNGPASGASLSSMRNARYPHHSSLFFGCDSVNGGNYWQDVLECGHIVSRGARVVASGDEYALIEDECEWRRPDADIPVIDRRMIRIAAPSAQLVLLDFDIELTALADIVIPTTNHSLFSLRTSHDLSAAAGGVMRNAEGLQGERATAGAMSAWMDCYTTRADGVEGIALMEHPSNRWFPSPWFTRDYGFLSPTPLNWPADGKGTTLKKGDRLRLRYRVAVHTGNTDEARIGELYKQYSNE